MVNNLMEKFSKMPTYLGTLDQVRGAIGSELSRFTGNIFYFAYICIFSNAAEKSGNVVRFGMLASPYGRDRNWVCLGLCQIQQVIINAGKFVTSSS